MTGLKDVGGKPMATMEDAYKSSILLGGALCCSI